MIKFFTGAAVLLIGCVARAAEPFDVLVPGPSAKDLLVLQGDYQAPSSSEAVVLVLLHGLGSHRGEWSSLLNLAADRGWGYYAFDLRGHGRSRGTLAGATVNFEDPRYGRRPDFWQQTRGDLNIVLAALERKKGVTLPRTALIGASLGANLALSSESGLPGLKALVLLSPGLDYAGIKTEGPIAALRTRTLMISAAPDLYSFTSSQRLAALAPPGLITWKPIQESSPHGAHGTQLFDGKLEKKILDWIGR